MLPETLGYVFGFILSLVAVCGGVLALFREKEIVNQQGHHVEVELDGVGTFKSNYPSVAAIALGLILGYFVVDGLHDVDQTVALNANLSVVGAYDGTPVFVAAVPARYHAASNSMDSEKLNKVRILVERLDGYSVIAYTVRGVRASGETVYSVAHGPAISNPELNELGFSGTLYVDKR
jgi:hypothetical protein